MADVDPERRQILGGGMSVEAEQSLIGSLLRHNAAYDRISDFSSGDFSRQDHATIYRAIQRMLDAGKAVDIVLLAEAMDAHGDLDRVGGLPYLGTLLESVNTAANVRHYAKLISDAAILRRLRVAAEEISLMCDSRVEPQTLASEAEHKILSVLDRDTARDYVHIGAATIEAMEWEEQDHRGLQMGFRDLDSLTLGLGNSNLVIVAGRPSMGKTSLAMQIAEQVSRDSSVAIFSLEMTRREIAGRMLRYHRQALGDSAYDHINDLKIHIDDTPAVTVGHILSRCRRIKRQHGLSLIVVDYIQLMRGDGDNRNQEIGSISRGLKGIAKEFDVPVIALSQLSRKVEERSDKRPVMSDLRESGEIEQDADLILFVYRDEVYDDASDAKGTAEIIARKNRNGPVGDCRLTFDGAFTRFGNYDGQRIERGTKRYAKTFTVVRD